MKEYEFYYTLDGSIGLYSYEANDVYHSKFGAISEAWEKFILQTDIKDRINSTEEIRVLDLCYGIGYNTKALMSYVINNNQYQDKINKIELKKFKTLIKKFKKYKKEINKLNKLKNKKLLLKLINIKSRGVDKNLSKIKKTLSLYTDKIYCDNLNDLENDLYQIENNIKNYKYSKIKIDCLDINEFLIKISPFIKTEFSVQEMILKLIPPFFKDFEFYINLQNAILKLANKFFIKNSSEIKELLDLKFNTKTNRQIHFYKIHDFVNLILIETLMQKYGNDYFDEEVKKALINPLIRKYIDPAKLHYALTKSNNLYKLIDKLNLNGFLHNIYYDYVSSRYNIAPFKKACDFFDIEYYVDDARKSIFRTNNNYDYIFLDAFTYSKAPELWTMEFFEELYQRLSTNGLLITYSNSSLVRNTLLANNFYVGKILDENNKSIGTVAAKEKSLIKVPLTNIDIGLCNTKAGIPYRDPSFSRTREAILKQREQDFKSSELPSSSQYLKQRNYKND